MAKSEDHDLLHAKQQSRCEPWPHRETVTHPCRHMQFDVVSMISVTLERDILQLDPKKQKNGEKEQSNQQKKNSFTRQMQIRIKTTKKPREKTYY
jgi:hypothetical protein